MPKKKGLIIGKLNAHQKEVLTLLAEECAEIIQVVSKIKRFGLYNHNPNDSAKVPNWQKLTNECGDFLFILAGKALNANLMLSEAGLEAAYRAKEAKVDKFMSHPNPPQSNN